MNQYQIVVTFDAESDRDAVGVMEYMDTDLNAAGLEGAEGFCSSLPKRHVPARWESVSYESEPVVEDRSNGGGVSHETVDD